MCISNSAGRHVDNNLQLLSLTRCLKIESFKCRHARARNAICVWDMMMTVINTRLEIRVENWLGSRADQDGRIDFFQLLFNLQFPNVNINIEPTIAKLICVSKALNWKVQWRSKPIQQLGNWIRRLRLESWLRFDCDSISLYWLHTAASAELVQYKHHRRGKRRW